MLLSPKMAVTRVDLKIALVIRSDVRTECVFTTKQLLVLHYSTYVQFVIICYSKCRTMIKRTWYRPMLLLCFLLALSQNNKCLTGYDKYSRNRVYGAIALCLYLYNNMFIMYYIWRIWSCGLSLRRWKSYFFTDSDCSREKTNLTCSVVPIPSTGGTSGN